jgi:hypothetical protein
MFGNHFYHETIKRAVSVFGTLFNNLSIKRADGTLIKVPLAYGPRSKWIARLQQQADLETTRVAISLPRMGFELSSIEYDASRKLSKKRQFKKAEATNPTKMQYQYAPAPYNLGFSLSVLVKNTDDGLQIIEQIMPYFTPDYTVTIHTVPDMNETRDIPIILTGVSQTDEYEGDFTTRQVLRYDLDFIMKNYIYGPIRTSEIIRTVKARTYTEPGSDGGFTDAAGKVIEQVITPNPNDADPDDTFTYNETTNFFEQPTVTYSDDKSSDPK